jgi:hypothetical protein
MLVNTGSLTPIQRPNESILFDGGDHACGQIHRPRELTQQFHELGQCCLAPLSPFFLGVSMK